MKKLIYSMLLLSVLSTFSNHVFAQCGMRSGGKKYSNITNPVAGDKDAAINGKVLFNNNCVICHGEAGNGEGELSRSLSRKPANLISKRVQQQNDSEIYWKITKGLGAMASFESILTDTQRWELVNYIRTLN